MSEQEAMTGHFAGCAIRPVKHFERTKGGFMVTLDCGHVQHKGGRIGKSEPCLEGPCYQPVREFAA